MSDATLPIALGAGTIGGLLWYGARRKAHARAPGVPDAAPPGAAASPMVDRPEPPERALGAAASAAIPTASTPAAIVATSALSAATASTPSPLPGRWIWPVEIYQGRRSVISNPWSTREGSLHRGVDLMFPGASDGAPSKSARKFSATVERWRPRLTKLADELDVDFLLSWIQHESGGRPCATGIPNKETGLFQTYHPHDDRYGATFAELRTACVPGKQTAHRPLTEAEQRLQVSIGVALARASMKAATSTLQAIGAQWSPRDRYCLAKLVHALPAYAHSFPRAFARVHGRPPIGWAEFRAWVRSLPDADVIAIDRGVRPWASVAQRDRLFGNAERTGAAVSGDSPRYLMPDGVRALAASDGLVWSAERTPRGFAVVIDHGALGLATFYTHLSRLLVTPTQRGASRQRVYAGQPIGVIGADPQDPEGLPHLHFEVWKGGPSDAIDPGPLMRWWEHISVPEMSPPPAAAPPPIRLPFVSRSAPQAPAGAAPTQAPGAALATPAALASSGGARNASLSFRPVGQRGDPYPEWIRSLDGKSGVYVIRELGPDGKPEIVYVGQSSAGRLYGTLTRHFQSWRRSKNFWRGQFTEHDPGLTYNRDHVEVAVRVTPASRALDEEARLIHRLRPRDNLIGQPDEEIPF